MKADKFVFLIVDDEVHGRNILREFISKEGGVVLEADSGAKALEILHKTHEVDIVITDLSMPEMSGLELIQAAKIKFPEIDFIVVTAHGSVESAINAMKVGAADYLLKPLELDELELRIQKICQLRNLTQKNEWLETENKRNKGSSLVVAESAGMKKLLTDLDMVVGSTATVLLTGETGAGKEVIARYIHESSPRKSGPFIAVNCSAIPENLLESQFFGHEKGAFTGADRRVIGALEMAHQGTLFLDELGEMDLKLQAKMLRVLEERSITRVGSQTPIKVDIRIVAATNQNLPQLVQEKKFREDLLYRIQTIHFDIPPLRERKEDILPLTKSFLERFAGLARAKSMVFDDNFIQILLSYPFPGNVRELRNLIERASLFAKGNRLSADLLPVSLVNERGTPQPLLHDGAEVGNGAAMKIPDEGSLSDIMADYEKKVISLALKKSEGDVEQTAKRLGVSRSALYAKMSKHGVTT